MLGRLGDPRAVPSLVKALADPNKTVRGHRRPGARPARRPQRGGAPARAAGTEAIRSFAPRPTRRSPRWRRRPAGKRAKIYLAFGPFTGGVKSAGPDAAKIVADALARELGKLPAVTLSLRPGGPAQLRQDRAARVLHRRQHHPARRRGHGRSSETNCDVKVMVARWPTKSIISWTNAGASLQSGSRPRDKESARRDCLEASAGQLAEDLGRFFKSQGG